MTAETAPLVSCIMPTRDRLAFARRAIDQFRRQDYEHRELIIVDDGTEGLAEYVAGDERVRYLHTGGHLTLGAKRNLACENARGSVIVHWDDDDWHAPHRLRYQVESLLGAGADICGTDRLLFYHGRDKRAWLYTYPSTSSRRWVAGGTLCYRRDWWRTHRFANVNVGEDSRFVFGAKGARVLVLPEHDFYVALIHGGNTSPKVTGGSQWRPHPVGEIERLVGVDWDWQGPGNADPSIAMTVTAAAPPATAAIKPVRNVMACLVHESRECVIDLVRNLHYLDPDSTILLYNGGRDPTLLEGFPWQTLGAVVHPCPKPMAWGWLHDFALDCMRFALDNLGFDTFTVVDSDQLGARPHYSRRLADALEDHSGVGMLVNAPGPQPVTSRVGPAVAAFKEINLWRPLLRRFPGGEQKFVHWCYWPSTVFTADAARDLTRFVETDAQMQEIMARTQIWATEEVILPTLVALLGYRVVANPCSYDYVRYRVNYKLNELDAALARPDVYWIHPVPRRYDDPLRKRVRSRYAHYETPARQEGAPLMTTRESTSGLLLTLPILARMRPVEGWLEEDEADLLIAAASRSLANEDDLPIVEVGSYCGRSTVVLGSVVKTTRPSARVYAVDPHDGTVGALDQGLTRGAGTLDRFLRNIRAADVADVVEVVQQYSYEVEWRQPIGLLLVDGLHDYASVSRDFYHFEPWLKPGSLVAFHDYAHYYPGVVAFVNELLGSGRYRKLSHARSMIVVERLVEE